MRVDTFSQERSLSGVGSQLERALISRSSSLGVTQVTKQLGTGGVIEVIVVEHLCQRIDLVESSLWPTNIAKRDRAMQPCEW
jgi:hypothetical protein